MTSIRQTKKAGKKLVAEGVILGVILDERRKRHYSRVYKRFHKAMQGHLVKSPPRRLPFLDGR